MVFFVFHLCICTYHIYIFQKQNGGVVMVNFYDLYINCPPNLTPNATLSQVAGNYISSVLAREHFDSLNNYPSHDDFGILATSTLVVFNQFDLWSHGLESDWYL